MSAAKEARLLELEQANANLQVRCTLAEARAEAPSAQNERLRMRSQLRAAQENARMANEDALAAHFMKNVSRHEARIANACSDQCTKRLAETAARLTHSEHEVVDLRVRVQLGRRARRHAACTRIGESCGRALKGPSP